MRIAEICSIFSYEISEALKPEGRIPRDSDPPIQTNVRLADGYVWLSGHWRKRMATRPEELDFDPQEVRKLFKDGLTLYKSDWEALPVDTRFILRVRGPRGKLGIVIVKQEHPDGSIRYILTTIHPELKFSTRQLIYQV